MCIRDRLRIGLVAGNRTVPCIWEIASADTRSGGRGSGKKLAFAKGACSPQENRSSSRDSANAAHATARHIPEWAAHHRRQEFDVIPGVALGTGPNGRIRRDAVQRSERACLLYTSPSPRD